MSTLSSGLSWRTEDAEHAPPKLDAALNPSVTTVQASTSLVEGDSDSLLLVSTGNGDLQLLQETGGQLSQKVYPLTASPPLTGRRSLCVAAAYMCAPGAHESHELALGIKNWGSMPPPR